MADASIRYINVPDQNPVDIKAVDLGDGTYALATSDGGSSNENRWTADHQPAENTVATIARAAPGAGFRLVITKIQVVICNDDAAPTAGSRPASLVEDAAGTPVTHWGHRVGILAVAGAMSGISDDVHIVLPENKSATLAFASAGGTDTFESVYMEGYTEAV